MLPNAIKKPVRNQGDTLIGLNPTLPSSSTLHLVNFQVIWSQPPTPLSADLTSGK